MAGIHHRVVRQGEQALLNATNQGVEVAPWQVGAANAAIKEHITGQANTLIFIYHCDMPGGMPRYGYHLQTAVTEVNLVAIMQQVTRLYMAIAGKAIGRCVRWHRSQHLLFMSRYFERQVIVVADEIIAQYMVYMAVRIEQAHRL